MKKIFTLSLVTVLLLTTLTSCRMPEKKDPFKEILEENPDMELPKSEVMEVDPEDIPVVDEELDPTSDRPVQNQAVARAVSELENDIYVFNSRFNNMATLPEGSTTGDAEVHDIRVGHDGKIYESAGDAVRGQYRQLVGSIETVVSEASTSAQTAVECAEIAVSARDEAKVSEENAKASELVATTLNQTATKLYSETMEMIDAHNKALGMATFEMDEEGYLTYTDDVKYTFSVDDEGMLNYDVSAQ